MACWNRSIWQFLLQGLVVCSLTRVPHLLWTNRNDWSWTDQKAHAALARLVLPLEVTQGYHDVALFELMSATERADSTERGENNEAKQEKPKHKREKAEWRSAGFAGVSCVLRPRPVSEHAPVLQTSLPALS